MAQIKAVFFDQDGVIIDTERDGHRVAFNMTFKEFGFTDEWSVEYYHELLQVAGGKERMKHHSRTKGFSKPVPEGELDDLVKGTDFENMTARYGRRPDQVQQQLLQTVYIPHHAYLIHLGHFNLNRFF